MRYFLIVLTLILGAQALGAANNLAAQIKQRTAIVRG